jgi:hypothetical protein
LRYFSNPEKKICGRFSTKQLEDLNGYLEEKNRKIIPQPPVRSNWLSHMLFLALPLIPLTFSKTKAQEVVQKSELNQEDFLTNNEPFLVTGIVVGEDDWYPISGVSVLNDASRKITFTDIEGKFEILVHKGEKLVFKGFGLEKKEIVISNHDILDVKLSFTRLESIVEVGFPEPTYKQPEDDLAPPPKGSLDLLPFFERVAAWFKKK